MMDLEQINCKWAFNHQVSPDCALCKSPDLPKQTYCLIDQGGYCQVREPKVVKQIKLNG